MEHEARSAGPGGADGGAKDAGDLVRISDGPFQNFTGRIEDVNLERGFLKVSVTIFGRSTPVELTFFQVQKL